MHKNLSSKDHQIFFIKSVLWLGLAAAAFISALAGFFYAWAIWIVFAIGAALLTTYVLKQKIIIRLSRELWIVSSLLLIMVVLFFTFVAPTVFSGRDQGAISEAAVHLAQNHTLKFSTPASNEFFKIYGQGRALNFPGFYYTSQGSLITQFPLVYISWLALFYAILGVSGFVVANAILIFLFFASFYLLIRLFLKMSTALPLMLFAATSFAFMWFSKFTLSENMALPLLWFSILSLMLLLKNPRKLFYIPFLLSSFLLFFTRIEGIAFLIVSAVIIFLDKEARSYIKGNLSLRFFLPIGILAAIFAANAFWDINFYREIVKALLPDILPQAQQLGTGNPSLPDFYLAKIFYIYGMLGFFILGFLGVLFQIWKKDIGKLIPFFIILPTLVYFLDAYITPDNPWMLRRFIFSLLPAAIFYSALLLGHLLERKSIALKIFSYAIALVLVIMNLPAFLGYFSFSEGKGLLAQTRLLSEKFASSDLVLIDREATGNGWQMISGPMSFLYGKNSVYFFNIQDLSKLDRSKFANIYLIAPNDQIAYYSNSTIGNKLVSAGDYSFDFTKLKTQTESSNGTVALPEKTNFRVSGKIFRIEN